MAERPFTPGFAAAPKSSDAAAFTPFSARFTRDDGQQELKGVDITLPPGATAKLDGRPLLPRLGDRRRSRQGRRPPSARKPSCPDKSQIGVATVSAGSGSSPLQIAGKAYLAGPYKGAPLSLVVITPGVAGPFDLGTVVVRASLFVDPETAQIHAVSDAIPDVFGGAKLDIRSIAVNVNKDDFTLNGTNCSKFASAGTLKGGGADPTNPAAFSSFAVSDPVQLDNCPALGFKPKLNLRLFGATKRAKHPRLRAVLKARAGRRQHRPRLGRSAARALPRPGAAWRRSAPGSSSSPATARRNRSTARRGRSRRCSASRSKVRSTCARRTTRCPISSPTSRVR